MQTAKPETATGHGPKFKVQSHVAVDVTTAAATVATANKDGNFAFLVHSQESLSQQSPPIVDNQRLARQKRRRTSPEDHAILEAEYEKNPKPDKAARLDIVSRVALGEKEVQIWFQNRRQVTRRKSRPLLPHEILANLRPPSYENEDAPTSSFSLESSSQSKHASSQSSNEDSPLVSRSQASETLPDVVHCSLGDQPYTQNRNVPLHVDDLSPIGNGSIAGAEVNRAEARDSKPGGLNLTRLGSLVRSVSQTLPKRQQIALKPRRRTASFTIHDDNKGRTADSSCMVTVDKDNRGSHSPTGAMRSLKRVDSSVRISMSLDGKAEVTTRTGTTPSPPRAKPAVSDLPNPRHPGGLQRSLSAIDHSCSDPFESMSIQSLRRPVLGRSRDARTWEFYCDRDVRDALSEQAEREESGSATAAIALIKSKSKNVKMMMNHGSKRHSQDSYEEGGKRTRVDTMRSERPKFGRSKSSMANLQTTGASRLGTRPPLKKSLSKTDLQSVTFQIYEGDSDKENWIPGTRSINHPRQGSGHPVQARRILKDTSQPSSSPGALNGRTIRQSKKMSGTPNSKDKENDVPIIDDEVAAFMSHPASSRESDDLDCVQNLLSLSQAAWH